MKIIITDDMSLGEKLRTAHANFREIDSEERGKVLQWVLHNSDNPEHHATAAYACAALSILLYEEAREKQIAAPVCKACGCALTGDTTAGMHDGNPFLCEGCGLGDARGGTVSAVEHLCVWWVTPSDLTVARSCFLLPPYIRREVLNMGGCAARGRLWVPGGIIPCRVRTEYLGDIDEGSGGIVFLEKDLPLVELVGVGEIWKGDALLQLGESKGNEVAVAAAGGLAVLQELRSRLNRDDVRDSLEEWITACIDEAQATILRETTS